MSPVPWKLCGAPVPSWKELRLCGAPVRRLFLGAPVPWKSKLQTTIALSTAAAEYYSASAVTSAVTVSEWRSSISTRYPFAWALSLKVILQHTRTTTLASNGAATSLVDESEQSISTSGSTLCTRRFRMATVAWFEWIPRSSLPTSLLSACSPAYTPRAWQDFWVTVVAGRGGRPAPRGDACLLSESSEGIPVYSAKAARGCLSTQRKQRGDACLLSESNSSPRQRPLRGVVRSGGSQRPEKDWLASGDIRVS